MESSDTQESTKLQVSSSNFPPQYFVCFGSSAGGLAVLETVLSQMPPDQGLCIILIMHLSPNSTSFTDEVLKKYTRMRIIYAEEGMVADANTIYIIASYTALTLKSGVFILSERIRLPIDKFLTSLALDQHEKAIAVILSGAGSDGSLGVKRIKEEGGLVIVQDPETAEYTSMPLAAVATKLADIISRPQEIPQQIVHWIKHRGKLVPEAEPILTAPTTSHEIQRIVTLLRAHTGHDFSLYKKNTLRRRIERRMIAQKVNTLASYVRLLEAEPVERERLLKEILIGVTSFFRDSEAFDYLKSTVITQLFQHVIHNKLFRIWVPGCSTGEEAYSIAMCVNEACQDNGWDVDLRIFASDIDKEAIEFAREGRYPKSIASEITPERLKRFFNEGVNEYRVKAEIKERIIFAVHNAVRDPPFSKVDFISCRNLMIYLESILQQKLLRIFHYALNPGGMLFLGSSETTGDIGNLFVQVEKKWKFFERKSTASTPSRPMDFDASYSVQPTPIEQVRTVIPAPRKPSIRELSQEFLLSTYVPASLICDSTGDILFIHGRMADYLETAPGEANMNIFTMARDEIKLEISRGFQKVLSSNSATRFTDIKIKRNNDLISIDIIVRPATELSYQQRLLVVSFEATHSEPITPENAILLDKRVLDEHTQNMERELLFTREHMQALVEQLETSNEELKSMNEELQSSNEELQSSNEELETAKEELQAVNEELVTLNTELHIKIEELSTAHNDLDNFLSSSSIATIFLNRQLLITRYSRWATRIFNLIPSDIGRSLGDFATQMKYDQVLQDAEEVLHILAPIERVVEMKDDRTLFMRITPYKTAENVIDGVVIGFSDITEQDRLKKIAAMYHEICEKLPTSLLVFDHLGKVHFANPEFCSTFGLRAGEPLGGTIGDLGMQGLPSENLDFRKWTGKIRLQGGLEHAITAEAMVIEVGLSSAMPHYLMVVHKLESIHEPKRDAP